MAQQTINDGETGLVVRTKMNENFTDLYTNKEPLKGEDYNYVTDAQLVVIENTSGTNTGDQDLTGLVTKATYDANTILKADSDDTPTALMVDEQSIVGRITAGAITALTATQVRTLLNVEDGAEVNAVDSVNGETGAITLTSSNINTDEIDGSSSKVLTAAQCKNTIINNYGQVASDVVLILPTAAAGMNFIAIVGTTQNSNTWKFKAASTDKIYLNGVAGNDGESIYANPNIGNYIELITFQVGANSWDWFTRTGQGTWQGQGNWTAGA